MHHAPNLLNFWQTWVNFLFTYHFNMILPTLWLSYNGLSGEKTKIQQYIDLIWFTIHLSFNILFIIHSPMCLGSLGSLAKIGWTFGVPTPSRVKFLLSEKTWRAWQIWQIVGRKTQPMLWHMIQKMVWQTICFSLQYILPAMDHFLSFHALHCWASSV